MNISSVTIKSFAILAFAGQGFIIYSICEFFTGLMPQWVALVDMNEDTSNEKTKDWTDIKKHWGRYLVHDSKQENKAWWEWSFRENDLNQAQSDLFKLVKRAYNGNEADDIDKEEEGKRSLNKACKFVYSVTWEKPEKNQLLNDVWIFCTIGGERLITLEKDNFKNKESWKSLSIDETKLVSPYEFSNLWWWGIREEEFNKGKITGTGNHQSVDKSKKKRSLLGECSHYYHYLPTDSMINKDNVAQLCGIGMPVITQKETKN